MKKLIILLILFPGLLFAAPFIVSDPVDSASCGNEGQPNCPSEFILYEDDSEIYRGNVEPDMSIRFDAAGRPAGTHTYKAIYVDQYGGLSLESNPTSLGSAPPSGLKLIP